jgi:hypothetical protein
MAVSERRVQSNRRCGARRSSPRYLALRCVLSLDKGLDKGSELDAVQSQSTQYKSLFYMNYTSIMPVTAPNGVMYCDMRSR